MNKLFGSLALSLLAPAAIAQCNITGSGTSYGSGDDFVANGGAGIDIGFAFPFAGQTFQFIHPSSNGFLHLSDGTVTITNSDFTPSEAEFLNLEPRIAVLWDDLNLLAGNGGEMWVDTSIGNQVTITWSNAILFGQSTIFNMSCTLYSSGVIDMSYDADVYQITDTIVGTTPGLNAVSPGQVDLSAGLPTADDTTFEIFAANTFDMSGQLLNLINVLPGYVPIVSAPVGCASKETYGTGCTEINDGIFELFAAGAQDIGGSGTAITFLRTGNSYTILDSIPGTFVPPTGNGQVVATGDDAFGAVTLSSPMPTANGTTTALTVCTNGYIALSANQPTPTADYSPSEAEFAAMTEPTICGPWFDWSPNQAGQIVAEEINGIVYVTWDAVQPYNSAPATDTFQYQFTLATGDCTIVYDNTSYAGGSAWHTPLFGYTSGGGAGVEALDLSAELLNTVTVADMGAVPLALDSNVPVLGTNWDITTSNIDAVSPVAITLFGLNQFNVPLTLVFPTADPSCNIHIDTVLTTATATAAAGSATTTVQVPNNPALVGGVLTAQSICLTLSNPANLLTSNGLQGNIGN